MYRPNFCGECGERLTSKSWRALMSGRFCVDCARRLGGFVLAKPVAILAITAIAFFALGRYLRPPPPPLLIQRAANSPLSDLPVNLNDTGPTTNRKEGGSTNQNPAVLNPRSVDEAGYICGARTKKGTPCRRRVHVAGERCFQHRGMPAILPLEKLAVK
jgi:hypothetical protein